MDRLIVILSGLLFLITWVFVFILVLQPDEEIYMIKNHSISTEMLISEKDPERFYVLVSHLGKPSIGEENIENQELNELIQFNNGEGVSIDVLLELFDLNDETAPQS